MSHLWAASRCCGYAKASQLTPVPISRQLNQVLDVYTQTKWLAICLCVVWVEKTARLTFPTVCQVLENILKSTSFSLGYILCFKNGKSSSMLISWHSFNQCVTGTDWEQKLSSLWLPWIRSSKEMNEKLSIPVAKELWCIADYLISYLLVKCSPLYHLDLL